MPADPTPDPAEMFGQTFAGAFGAFTVCLICGALLADGAKDLHRGWHEAITLTEMRETPNA